MAKLGIQTIEMYCNLVREQFAPILAELDSRESEIRSELETLVKKEFGIYELYTKKAKLKAQLDELERQLKGWEDKKHTQFGWLNPIQERVGVLLRKSRNGLRKDVEKKMNDSIYAIKLSGLDSNTKSVFDQLPKTIENLTKKLEKLPPPSVKKLIK